MSLHQVLVSARKIANPSITCVAVLQVAKGKEETFLSLARVQQAATRCEEGCIKYDLEQDLEDKHKWYFIEKWTSEGALKLHGKSRHTREFNRQLGRLKVMAGKPHLWASRLMPPSQDKVKKGETSILETYKHVFHPQNMNQNMLRMKYAVRGEILIRANEIQNELQKGSSTFPFSEVTYCNIGNPQKLGQKPLTFPSQVLSLINYPTLMEKPNLFPSDVVERARSLLDHMPGGLGSYSHSQGLPYIRESVARFIEKRDGYPANPDHIFLSDGASAGIKYVMRMLRQHSTDAFLVPNPQYPLYSAVLANVNAVGIPYTLREDKGWDIDLENLHHMILKARDDGLTVKAMVVINPGNPTGQCLGIKTMRAIVNLCTQESIVLCADEVYQVLTYNPQKPFHSFKKVWMQMQEMGGISIQKNPLELFSFHSVSKGVFGECGRRGGYLEVVNGHPVILQQLYKAASVSLCPNTLGQVVVNLMVDPPKAGSPSYQLFQEETKNIYDTLKRRANLLGELLNSLKGVTCNMPEGAMYAFPLVSLGPGAIAAAKKAGQAPDTFYCFQVLENTGLVVVPGSGFILSNLTNSESDFFFRTTFLPPEAKMLEVFNRFKAFHIKFMTTYQ